MAANSYRRGGKSRQRNHKGKRSAARQRVARQGDADAEKNGIKLSIAFAADVDFWMVNNKLTSHQSCCLHCCGGRCVGTPWRIRNTQILAAKEEPSCAVGRVETLIALAGKIYCCVWAKWESVLLQQA